LRPTLFIVTGLYGAIFSSVCAMSAKHCTQNGHVLYIVEFDISILVTVRCFWQFLIVSPLDKAYVTVTLGQDTGSLGQTYRSKPMNLIAN